MDNSEQIWRLVDAKKDPFEALSDRIWGMPELQYAEHRSVAEHITELEREGSHRAGEKDRAGRSPDDGDLSRPEGHQRGVEPMDSRRSPMVGSTDVGDVSWMVPTVQAHCPTYAIGTPGHSWQLTAQGKTPAAKKGMVHAAKVMAATAVRANLGVRGSNPFRRAL